MKFAGHTESKTFGNNYSHPVTEVDGPANFLGMATRRAHILNRRGLGIHLNQDNYWNNLPAKADFEFHDRPDVQKLDEEIETLGLRISHTKIAAVKDELRLKQLGKYRHKRKLYLDALKSSQSEKLGCDIRNQTVFQYRCRAMPERDLLATLLPKKVELRSQEGRQALEALEALCRDRGKVFYRQSLQPQNGKCDCGALMSE